MTHMMDIWEGSVGMARALLHSVTGQLRTVFDGHALAGASPHMPGWGIRWRSGPHQ